MDRPVPRSDERRARIRRAAGLLLPAGAVIVALAWLPAWIRPSLALARLRTATVAAGSIDEVITASGTVVPDIERVLSSPLDARVLRVLQRPGARLDAGDPVVALDVSEAELQAERVGRDLTLKDNQQAQARLALQTALSGLDGRIQLKEVELESLQARQESHRVLFADALVSRDALEQTSLAVKQAGIELAQLREERQHAEEAVRLQLDGLTAERQSLLREADEARRLLELATTKTDRAGVLTWVLSQEGVLVRRGDVIARIADLTSFRIDAAISDVHADRLRGGLPVLVRLGDLELEGTVADVLPTIENGTLRFTVTLLEPAHGRLRPSLRVDVLVVIGRSPRTLTVKRGPFADGAGGHHVFVVSGARAVRTPVAVGLRGFDEVEILSGLAEGDQIIVSDMSDYAHLDEVAVY